MTGRAMKAALPVNKYKTGRLYLPVLYLLAQEYSHLFGGNHTVSSCRLGLIQGQVCLP